jgi:hypothetical protein
MYDPGDGIKRMPWAYYCEDQGRIYHWATACFCINNYCLIFMNDLTKGCPLQQYTRTTSGSIGVCSSPYADCGVTYSIGNHTYTIACLGYTGGAPIDCYVMANYNVPSLANKRVYRASYPICPECGIYLFAGQPENVLGSHGACESNFAFTKDVNCARCSMFDDPSSTLRTAAFCYQLQPPTCMDCVKLYCTCSECIRCVTHVVFTCNCDSIRVSPEEYCYDRAHAKLDGVIPMRNGDVVIAAGNGYGRGLQNNYTQATCLISYTKGVITNNHIRWLGIAQNTVAIGETVKIAVPGMTDRSSFTQNNIIDGTYSGAGTTKVHQLRMCSRTGLACQLFGCITGNSSACSFCLYGNEYINFHPRYDCNKGGYVSYFTMVGCC